MAKKKKSKATPAVTYEATAAPATADDNDDLLNDLISQIDEKDAAAQHEGEKVRHQVELNNQADALEREASNPDSAGASKKDSSRARFEARKVRHLVHCTL